jgi:dCTP deaminase
MLSDVDIRRQVTQGHLGIEPFDPAALQPASYDLTLDREFLIPNPEVTEVDLADVPENHMTALRVDNEGLTVEPGEFLLACTRERVTVGEGLLGRVEGKSSIGRLGLIVHITAGFIDPGFTGQITLELFNASPWDLVLYPGQRIAQIAFSFLATTPARPYGQAGNHYQGQVGPTASRFRHEPSVPVRDPFSASKG